MSTNVFNTGAHSFTRKYLIKNPGEDQNTLSLTFEKEYYKCLGEIVEQLMYFDKITIKVYGENLSLVILINELGVKKVLQLVEEGVIEFLLWTTMITTIVSNEMVGKMNPLQSAVVDSKVHCEAGESVKMGLRSLKVQPDRNTRRDIERKVSKAYKMPKPDFAKDAVDIINSAYESNKLAEIGLPNERDIIWLLKEERFKLLGAADDILETTILADFKLSSIGNYQYFSLSKQSFEVIEKASKIFDGAKKINEIERLPDMQQLLLAKEIDLKKIVDLRKKPVSRKFRRWLYESVGNDSEYILKEYIDEIAEHKVFFETNKGKFIKTMGMFGIGGAIGALTGNVTGTVAGMAAGKILEPAADLGLSFIDTYLLDGLLKGWQPRLFINEYQKIIVNPVLNE
jgi:hypothetical protein